jgi:hypothetical protein
MTAPAATAGWPTTPCKGCGKPVIWATTANLRPMPVDPEPAAEGNVVLMRLGLGVRAEVITNPGRLFGRRTYVSHFVTCPKAAEFRRPRGRR